MSHFAHLPLTLKSPPSNTDHHPYFLLIFPIFYCKSSFRDTLLSIFGNVNWTLKKVPQPPPPTSSQSFSMSVPLCYFYFLFNIATPSIFGNGQWILKTVGPYSLKKAFINKKKFTNNTSNSEKS